MKDKDRLNYYRGHFVQNGKTEINNYKEDIENYKERFVFLKIHKYLLGQNTIDDNVIYSAACGIWKLNLDKCKEADYVLALDMGIVVGVYKVQADCWSRIEDMELADKCLSKVERYKEIKALHDKHGKGAKRVYFAKSDEECNDKIKELRGKEIYYNNNREFLKTQGAHYSLNWGKRD